MLDDEEQIDEQFLDDTEFVDTEEEDCNDGDSVISFPITSYVLKAKD